MKFNNITQKSENTIESSPASTVSVKKLLEECYESDSKKRQAHRKLEGYLSISQIAGKACLRKAYYTLNNYPSDKVFNFESHSILEVGTLYHELVQSTMIRGNKLHYVEQFMKCDKYKICGSTDGLLRDDSTGEYILNDFKTIGTAGFDYVVKTNKAKKDHISQVHLYAYMFSNMFNIPIKKMKITYLHKNQNFYSARLDTVIKNIQSNIGYLENVLNYMQSKDQNTLKIETQLAKLHHSVDELEGITTKKEDEDYHIKEIDFNFNQETLDIELNKVDDFWKLVENNKKIEEDNKKAIEYNKTVTKKKDLMPIKTIRLPNKISTDYICNSCPFLQVCRNGVKL